MMLHYPVAPPPTPLPVAGDAADALNITGGRPLSGNVRVQSAKNSALYLILAALLTPEPVVLRNIPRLSDVLILVEMMAHFGAAVRWVGSDLHIHAHTITTTHAPYRLVSRMRASFVALGALLGRSGEACISLPGGCAFGPRPVDRHIKAFRDLGAVLSEHNGDFYARRASPLAGHTHFEAPTVGGTQNIILAAALGEGRVVISNAALEPEVADLATMLNRMGADIKGAGSSTITIQGVPALCGIDYRPLPDRIEAGTFMLAAAATRGTLTLSNIRAEHMGAVIAKLRETGVKLHTPTPDTLVLDARGPLSPVDLTASEYPGIPTDLQAPFGALLATIPGQSSVRDTVYPDRFTHVGELARMGVRLELSGRTLTLHGGMLRGAAVHAADIRAGGALVVAALAALGKTSITGVQYIARGYDDLSNRLRALGASIYLDRAPELATGTYGD